MREMEERMAALDHAPLFISAALPAKVFPPLFNRYGEGIVDFRGTYDEYLKAQGIEP